MALEAFLKQNKKEQKTTLYPASESFVDENGRPMMWKLRPLGTLEAENIRKQCQQYGKGGIVKVDTARFNREIAVKCTVEPNLNDKQLQDSYGVMGAEDLIAEMLDKDGEYQAYVKKCMEISGYKESEADLVDEVKN